MQPWDFIVVSQDETKAVIKQGFDVANAQSAQLCFGERQEKYNSLQLADIMEVPLGICVTCDRERNGPIVLGQTIKPEMDLYSTVCDSKYVACRQSGEYCLGLGELTGHPS